MREVNHKDGGLINIRVLLYPFWFSALEAGEVAGFFPSLTIWRGIEMLNKGNVNTWESELKYVKDLKCQENAL